MTQVLELTEVGAERVAENSSQVKVLPFWIAGAVYLASSLALLVVSWRLAGGHFVYPLDDVYINMAVAKQFALHGVWGVSPYEFSSSTSSPLYVLLLAGVYRLFGVNLYAPLVLSFSFGLGSLWVAAGMVRPALSPKWTTWTLIAFALLAPLFAVGTLGMEHTLHLLLALLFLRLFSDEKVPLWTIALVTALMTGARYEGILMAAMGTLLLLWQRRRVRAAAVAVAAWIPPALYAAYSMEHGGYWLPNSVAIKGVHVAGLAFKARLIGLEATAVWNLARAPHLALILIATAAMAWALSRRDERLAGMLVVFSGTGVLHLLTAAVGWVYRYETYLVGSGLVLAAAAWPALQLESKAAGRRAAVFVAILCMPLALLMLGLRSGLAAITIPPYSRATYQQQWQTGRFLAAYYPQERLAANDIGLINYLGDLHCFDLGGLASGTVFRAKRESAYTTNLIQQQADARGVQIAVVYDSWFSLHPISAALGGPPLPASWIRVGQWTVPKREQLGDRTVSWYGLNPAAAATLRANLAAFEPSLPKEVSVSH